MPLITTHNFFANEVLNKTAQVIRMKILPKKHIYELFAQSFDVFMFYDFFRFSKENLISYCHNNETDTYFLNLIKNIKASKQLNNPEVLAALYGHLTHYVLDSNCHPYIVYKTGVWDSHNKDTQKYNGLHSHMEMQIDAYLYEQKFHKPFKDFKIHCELITKEKLSPELIDILNKTYEQTFSIENGGVKYQIGQRNMYYTYKYLIEDKTGIKTFLYKIIDFWTPHKQKYQYFSSHITQIDETILNKDHQPWYHPWLTNKISTSSFLDLYETSMQEALVLFTKTDDFLHDKINEKEYLKYLQDKSYLTGLSWKKKVTIKHLEF